MAKNNYFLEKNRRFYKGCKNSSEICPLVEELEGASERKIPLFIQFVYSLIAVMILGDNKVEGKEWFISLLLFSSPLFLEYIQYTSKNKLVNFIYIIQKICFAFTSMLGVIGVLTEIITIKINNAVSYIQISKTFFMLSGKEITIGWYCIH